MLAAYDLNENLAADIIQTIIKHYLLSIITHLCSIVRFCRE